MSQVQKLSQPQLCGSMWSYMAKHQQAVAADDSWEVRAFAEDTSSAMGTTWPPRSYTCNFCRREFRSAQALGGHMNVHRRDRARLRQSFQGTAEPSSAAPASMILSSSQFDASAEGGLCLFYPIQNLAGANTPSTMLSISPYQAAINFPTATALLGKVGMVRDRDDGSDNSYDSSADNVIMEELDLELRLGW